MPRGSLAFGRSSQATAVSARIRWAHSAGALVALGFEAFRRVVVHEIGAGGSAPPPSVPTAPAA